MIKLCAWIVLLVPITCPPSVKGLHVPTHRHLTGGQVFFPTSLIPGSANEIEAEVIRVTLEQKTYSHLHVFVVAVFPFVTRMMDPN